MKKAVKKKVAPKDVKSTPKKKTKKSTPKKAAKKAVAKKIVKPPIKERLASPVLKERIIEMDDATIIEHPPTYRSMFTSHNREYRNSRAFLYFPYVVHIIRRHKSYGGHTQQSLHVGFRAEPLPRYKKDIRKSTFLYPLVSNVYAKWLLVCSPASVHGFWRTVFNGHAAWPDHILRKNMGLEIPEWEKIHPDDFMAKLLKWPETIKCDFGQDGLPRAYSDRSRDMPCKLTYSDIFGKLDRGSLNHVDGQNRYDGEEW